MKTELLRLAAEYGIHLLYKHQHQMGEFGGSADYCNLYALMQAGLGNYDRSQVPLEDIIALAKKEIE